MFALHARHRELENRRKRAQFCYKKVAAKRFVKVFSRLGRKQSILQIFPLFHTYPFKAENPPSLQLLQYPRGSSGFTSFLLQPLKWSPDLTIAQGVTDTALALHQGPRGGRSRTNISPASQTPLGAETSCLPSPGLSPGRTEVTAGFVTDQCPGGNRSCLTGRSEQRAQVPTNAHKVHECRDVSSLPPRLAQPGTGRGCAVLHPPTRDQPSPCQVPSPVQEPAAPPLPSPTTQGSTCQWLDLFC